MRTVRARGFSLPELLVVLAILGLSIAVVVPLVASSIRQAKIRGAADQFASDLKAARMVAVTQRVPVQVTVAVDPANTYQYQDTGGRMPAPHAVTLPQGVVIEASTTPITFRTDGSVTGGATTRLLVTLDSDASERWTITTSVAGVTRVTRQRITS